MAALRSIMVNEYMLMLMNPYCRLVNCHAQGIESVRIEAYIKICEDIPEPYIPLLDKVADYDQLSVRSPDTGYIDHLGRCQSKPARG